MDQKIISGIGNIYADEILFEVNIHPETPSNLITINESNKIVLAAKKILKKAIELKGTTIKNYTFSLNAKGQYQKYLKVHQRVSKLCFVCKNIIKKIKVGGRGTYLCEWCQIKK